MNTLANMGSQNHCDIHHPWPLATCLAQSKTH